MLGAIIALSVTLTAPPVITPGEPAATPASAPAATPAAPAVADKTGVQVNSPPAPEAKPKDDPDRVICRTEPVIGSRFNKRVCMTKAQMDERDRELQQYEQRRENTNGMTLGHASAFSGN